METLKFKTNINCGGCIAKVTPSLNGAVGEGKWQVDTTSKDKVLTIESDIKDTEIIQSVKQAGFNIEKL